MGIEETWRLETVDCYPTVAGVLKEDVREGRNGGSSGRFEVG